VWWPKLLLAGAAGVSFVLNVAHAEHNWAARGVAAIPPAALVLGVELLMMVLRRATMRANRLQAEAEAAQEAAMTAPLQRIQIEAMRRPRAAAAAAVAASATPPPPPADTFRQAVAEAKGSDEARPRRRQAPYMVAAAILDEWADGDSPTPAELAEAMAGRGVIVSQSTAQALLRELRAPLSTRLAGRRPTRPANQPRPAGTGNGGPAARPR
jgi:hypothetical protein